MILHEIRNALILKSPWMDLVAVPRPASLPAQDAALSELIFPAVCPGPHLSLPLFRSRHGIC